MAKRKTRKKKSGSTRTPAVKVVVQSAPRSAPRKKSRRGKRSKSDGGFGVSGLKLTPAMMMVPDGAKNFSKAQLAMLEAEDAYKDTMKAFQPINMGRKMKEVQLRLMAGLPVDPETLNPYASRAASALNSPAKAASSSG